jgi:hypothetical protein
MRCVCICPFGSGWVQHHTAAKAVENTADMVEESADAVRENSGRKADNMEEKADMLNKWIDGVDSEAEQNMEHRAAAVCAAGENKANIIEYNPIWFAIIRLNNRLMYMLTGWQSFRLMPLYCIALLRNVKPMTEVTTTDARARTTPYICAICCSVSYFSSLSLLT